MSETERLLLAPIRLLSSSLPVRFPLVTSLHLVGRNENGERRDGASEERKEPTVKG